VKKFLCLILTLFGFGCGGGSSSSSSTTAAPSVIPDRKDLYYGYYGDTDTIVSEVKDHANTIFVFGWPTGETAVKHSMEAIQGGIPFIILGVNPDINSTRSLFDSMRSAKCLNHVVALYPYDEPDVQRLSDDEVKQTVFRLMELVSQYPELAQVKFAVFYGNTGYVPGISVFDWVGRDNYNSGPQTLPLSPNQKLMLIPGGAFGEKPEPFLDFANNHPEVVAIIPFIWEWPKQDHPGIKGSLLEENYRNVGKRITH
jgi:hypothetical protein